MGEELGAEFTRRGSCLLHKLLPIFLLCGAFIPDVVRCDLQADGSALLGFLNGLAGAARVMNWSNTTSPCSWRGVGCSKANDSVEALKLPGTGLYGYIRPGTLGLLSHLQTLSLRSNHLSGPLPEDLLNLSQLRKLYLQNNLFSGPIPAFNSSLTPALNVIDLSFNSFSGEIPSSYSTLSLRILLLQNNALSGAIPQDLGRLVQVNLANNNLSGSIPPTLQNMPNSSFSGNPGLCGPPLSLACTATPSPPLPSPPSPPLQNPPQTTPKRKLSKLDILLIVIADVVFLLLVGACCILCYSRKNLLSSSSSQPAGKADTKADKKGSGGAYEKTSDYSSKDELFSAQELQQNKLVFFQGRQLSFDLEDLLRASAEVLGKGGFGTTYKAVLEDGPIVVVKRLKEVSVSRREFEQQLDFIGRLRHRHLVPLRAYFFSKEEKLLVHEFLPMGSLAAILHGARKGELDWETRIKIGIGACKGLAHLHGTSNKAVHGNIKSSNVLLHGEYDACLSDYGITSLFSSNFVVGRTGGYRAPEVIETRKVSQMSDVFSFGVVLLEMLTGKAPWLMMAELNMDLPRWVQSVVREEWTSEVFDKELLRYENIEEEMVHMLQVALACVCVSPLQRPRIHEVLKMISSVRPGLLQSDRSDSSPSSTSYEGGTQQGSQPQTSPLDAQENSNDSTSTNPSPLHRSSQRAEPSTSNM